MLIAIKQHFIQHHTATLQELSLKFKQPPDCMRNMLCHWIRKGKLSLAPRPQHCGTRCQLCKPSIAEVYQWQDA